MTRKVVVTPVAREELDDLAAFIAVEQVAAAKGLLGAFASFVEAVAAAPHMGVALRSIRRWIIPRYRVVIFYHVTEESVEVLRVLHGARNLDPIIDSILGIGEED